MHFCTAYINIGGDNRNIMYRDEFSPISWPEVLVLREIHGSDAVGEVIPFVEVKQTPRDERQRLLMKYPEEVLGAIWGGKNAPSELSAAGVKQRPDIVWMNPLSGQTEKTTTKGSEPYTIPPEKRTVAEIVGNYAVRDDAAAREKESEYYVDEPEEAPAPVEDEALFEEPKTAAKKR